MKYVGAMKRRGLSVAALVVAALLVTVAVVSWRTEPEARATGPLRIAVVGDFYTVGTQNLQVWPTLMAERTGWAVSNSALPGAGYTADGRGGYAFGYQVDRATAERPDLIVVFGGTSDTGASPEQVTQGVRRVLEKLTLTGTRAIIIGPTWYATPIPSEVSTVADIVRTAAESAALPYVDALSPPWLTTTLMRSDETGPTDDGQSVLADRIAAAIRAEVGQ